MCFKMAKYNAIRAYELLMADTSVSNFRVKLAPCNRGMAQPKDAVGGDGLQMWRESVRIPTLQCKTNLVTKCHKEPRTWILWINDLS
jgi:hypothetical protein